MCRCFVCAEGWGWGQKAAGEAAQSLELGIALGQAQGWCHAGLPSCTPVVPVAWGSGERKAICLESHHPTHSSAPLPHPHRFCLSPSFCPYLELQPPWPNPAPCQPLTPKDSTARGLPSTRGCACLGDTAGTLGACRALGGRGTRTPCSSSSVSTEQSLPFPAARPLLPRPRDPQTSLCPHTRSFPVPRTCVQPVPWVASLSWKQLGDTHSTGWVCTWL